MRHEIRLLCGAEADANQASEIQWNNAFCICHKHVGLQNIRALFFYCTAEMGGGERGKKIRLLIPEKYQRWI